MPKKYHHSPDEYNDSAVGSEAPPRQSYAGTPTNVTRAESGKKAGNSTGSVQRADGTGNLRADYKTKGSTRAEAGAGKQHWPDVESYNDSKELP